MQSRVDFLGALKQIDVAESYQFCLIDTNGKKSFEEKKGCMVLGNRTMILYDFWLTIH